MNVQELSLTLTEALLRTAKHETSDSNQAQRRPPFSITLSREAGALGTTVAEAVGKRLGWPLYDDELIEKIADELGEPASYVRDLDERSISWLQEFIANLVNKYHFNPTAYFRALVGFVRGLGALGQCVIVGRGSSFLLPHETTLRVRLVANWRDRVRAVQRLKGLSEREATRFINRTEQERSAFMKDHFKLDAGDPHHYDLVLNMSFVDVEDAAEIIVATLRRFEKRQQTKVSQAGEAALR
jgi:cytidylate kinase